MHKLNNKKRQKKGVQENEESRESNDPANRRKKWKVKGENAEKPRRKTAE
jgi:hypothetical protein